MHYKKNKLKLAFYRVNIVFLFLGFAFFLTQCKKDNNYKKYETLVEKELAKRERSDSLFFGFYFGMTSKQFYILCWQKNKQGLFTDGANNSAVLYNMKDELKHPASMNFYPEFHENKIIKMGVSYRYDGWSPWNKHLSSDSLLNDVLRLYKQWYKKGNSFIEISDKERGTIYVKVDNNRRIIIGKFDEMHVKVDYTDLLMLKN